MSEDFTKFNIEEDDEPIEKDEVVQDDERIEEDEPVVEVVEYPPEDEVVGKPEPTISYPEAHLLTCPHCGATYSSRLSACPGCGTFRTF